MKLARLVLIAVALGSTPLARAQEAGVINDPDGDVNVRVGKSAEAAVIATVKTGEPFTFKREGDDDWYKVTLASGKSGWMHLSLIRLHFTEKDLPTSEKDPAGESEIDESARRHGFNYATGTRRAARGDFKLLKKFFELARDVDGAASESFGDMPTVVYHLLGDEKFAQFLAAQSLAFRIMVRNQISHQGYPAPASEYLSRHFPQATQLLFRREVVDWPSPNDQYAIRKTFSSEVELAGSKVERAELIEKKTGRVLCNLTPDDIGTGADREGEALWSPDSERVACLSTDLPAQPGDLLDDPPPPPQRKQVAVYQRSGDSFARVDLSLGEAPGYAADKELQGAGRGHIFTEPVRWRKPNVLLLSRHEYYRKMMPTVIDKMKFDSIHDLARQYQITATFAADGKADVVWKLEKD